MHNAHIAISAFLALVFLISGLMKASGQERGLSTTRGVKVRDSVARVVGVIEVLAAFGILIGMRNSVIQWLAFVVLWFDMGGAMYLHLRAQKIQASFPPFFLLTLISIALVTI